MDLLKAAASGPDVLAKALADLPDDKWEANWMQIDAAIVRSAGYTFEGFMSFARLMLYNPGDGIVLEPEVHHKQWIHTCLDENRVCILAPPESAKTTIISVLLTAFTIGHFPYKQNIVVSVSDDQAEKVVGTIVANIEGHPAWRMCFPDVMPDKKRGWGFNSGFFVKRKGPYAKWLQERAGRTGPTLLGVGYSNRAIIGRRVDGVFIVDDMMDETNTRSEAELDYAKAQFNKVISSRVTEDGKLILVGTPWREDDVYATAVSTGLYTNYITPAWEEKGARLISYWPKQWPIERLERKRKELGEKDFRLMYLMDLKAQSGTVLKEEWLHPFFPSYQIDSAWPIYYGIDFAITSHDLGLKGRGHKRSYFAIAKIVHAPFGLIVWDGWRGQVGLGQAIDKVRQHADADLPKKIHIEVWGGGEGFLQQMVRELPGHTILPYRDTKDKTLRFSKMARHFETGRIRVNDAETKFLRVFKNEWIGYPTFPTSDTLDAVAAGIDATGFLVYSGEKLTRTTKKVPKSRQKLPWGGTLGMPPSKFAPGGKGWRG